MTILTVVVPCYNSAEYMSRCIDSLLVGAEDVEIIIVDDGSKDATGEIADRYAEQFNSLVSVIHQENGGHGAAVNAGVAAAKGTYVKIVDSDDWVAPDAYTELLSLLRGFEESSEKVDLVITNFTYEAEDKRHKRVSRYTNCLPVGRVFGWEEIGHFRLWQYMLMHSMLYRTEVLHDSGLQLPKHTFYVDNIYAFVPLPDVKKLYYANIDLYLYYIGRADQSVNESVMIGRMDQQVAINRIMFSAFSKILRRPDAPESLLRYMAHYLSIITMVSSILMIVSKDPKLLEQKEQLWKDITDEDPKLAGYMRRRFFGQIVNLPGKGGRVLTRFSYRAANKVIGFN